MKKASFVLIKAIFGDALNAARPVMSSTADGAPIRAEPFYLVVCRFGNKNKLVCFVFLIFLTVKKGSGGLARPG